MRVLRYRFKLHVDHYARKPDTEDLRYLEVSGIRIINKPAKHGGYEISPFVKKHSGAFYPSAGSFQFPELVPMKRGVTLELKNFPKFPVLMQHELVDLGYITITDIEEHAVYIQEKHLK